MWNVGKLFSVEECDNCNLKYIGRKIIIKNKQLPLCNFFIYLNDT